MRGWQAASARTWEVVLWVRARVARWGPGAHGGEGVEVVSTGRIVGITVGCVGRWFSLELLAPAYHSCKCGRSRRFKVPGWRKRNGRVT
jgi:hypothetical protein